MNDRKRVIALTMAVMAAMTMAAEAAQPGRGRAPAPAAPPPDELVVEQVRGNVYMIGGAGGNITVQLGKEGVIFVDTGLAARSADVLAALRKITPVPVTMIINTHYHADHTGGNATITMSGRSVNGGTREVVNRAAIWGHESVLNRVSAEGQNGQPVVPEVGWPIETYFTASQDLFFNDEAVQLVHIPNAHTDGDTIVFFRRSDVIATGDIFNTTMYPYLDPSAGGHINGLIAGLNKLIDLAIPDMNEEGGTLIVSGHGRIGDEYDLLVYRDALTIIRDRIEDLIKKGMTLEQVRAARPTLDYDGIYGASSGFWTTDQFIEAVYNNLKAQPTGEAN